MQGGTRTALTQPTPDVVAREIEGCRFMADNPDRGQPAIPAFAHPPDYPAYIQAIIDGGVQIVETAGNNPQQWLPLLRDQCPGLSARQQRGVGLDHELRPL